MAYKVAAFLSHPVQYFSPLWANLNADPEIDLTVYYGSDEGVRTMKDAGFGVDVKWDTPLLDGYQYKFFKNYSLFSGIFNGSFGLMNFGIVRELFAHKFDVVILHSWSFFTEWLIFGAALISRTPIFLRVETPLNQEFLKPVWKRFIKHFFLSFLFKGISAFLCIGTENKEFYRFLNVPARKIFFTPYAVDNDRLIKEYNKLRDQKHLLRQEIGIVDDKVIFLFVGKFIPKKRVMDLVHAFERMDVENKVLMLVGDGVLRKDVKDYIADKNLRDVHLVGFKNQTELPSYYAMADVFVLPSDLGETWGLVVNEAMCFGLPVVVSDVAGSSKDLVMDGENGFVVKVRDVNQLTETLSRLANDSVMRSRMGKKSLQMITNWSYAQDKESFLLALRAQKGNCKNDN